MPKQTEVSTGAQVAGTLVVGLISLVSIIAVLLLVGSFLFAPSQKSQSTASNDSSSSQNQAEDLRPAPAREYPSSVRSSSQTGRVQRGQGLMPTQQREPQIVLPPQNIFEAAERGTVQDVKRFLAAGANVNTKDDRAWTPLHYAAESNSDLELLKYLLDQGADVNAISNMGHTPLDRAYSDEKKRILRGAMRKPTETFSPPGGGGFGGMGGSYGGGQVPTQPSLPPGVTDLNEALKQSGFGGKYNSLGKFVQYGSAELEKALDQAETDLSRVSQFDDPGKMRAQQAIQRAKANIRAEQNNIAQKIFVCEYTYSVFGAKNHGGGISSFTMRIPTDFNDRMTNRVKVLFPSTTPGVTVEEGKSEYSKIELLVKGRTDSIGKLVDKKDDYRVKIQFYNLQDKVDRYGSHSVEATVQAAGIVESK